MDPSRRPPGAPRGRLAPARVGSLAARPEPSPSDVRGQTAAPGARSINSRAFSPCSRFSAWSNTTETSDSKTSAVTPAAMRGQAVHEQGARFREAHQLVVHLETARTPAGAVRPRLPDPWRSRCRCRRRRPPPPRRRPFAEEPQPRAEPGDSGEPVATTACGSSIRLPDSPRAGARPASPRRAPATWPRCCRRQRKRPSGPAAGRTAPAGSGSPRAPDTGAPHW